MVYHKCPICGKKGVHKVEQATFSGKGAYYSKCRYCKKIVKALVRRR
jgi:formate dehydrogenase maturation protein FdhE